jgi:hypothetical protein
MGAVEVEGAAATAAILDMAEERERQRTSREFLAEREECYRVTCEWFKEVGSLKGLWTVESRVEFAFLYNLNEILIYVLIEVKFIFILILFGIFKFDPVVIPDQNFGHEF